ncbi:MAG: carboxynorspermidine decarboxylase [Bacteroidales bacterium]
MTIDFSKLPSPCYVLEEEKLLANLKLIRMVMDRAGVQVILAFKGFAMWSTFPIVRKYISSATASSLHEARLSFEEMGALAHTYCVVYKPYEFEEILSYSSHITFNSLAQFKRFCPQVKKYPRKISMGLRVNHGYSEVETELYNPCSVESRLGVWVDNLQKLPKEIEGLHFHSLCESSAEDTEKTLRVFEEKCGKFFEQLKWVNFGGGHLMTRKDYNIEHLISVLRDFKERHSHLHVILEPGSAFGWETGFLHSTVMDVVDNHYTKTAILDVSFSAHMPDCLEMPYKPEVRGAKINGDLNYKYRLGGNSCLAGDFMESWTFDKELQIGDSLIFEDMIHYTMVKTTTFNGIEHPSIGVIDLEGNFKLVKKFDYQDYKGRLS